MRLAVTQEHRDLTMALPGKLRRTLWPFPSLPGGGSEAISLCVCVMPADKSGLAPYNFVPAGSCARHACVRSSRAPGGCCSHSNDACCGSSSCAARRVVRLQQLCRYAQGRKAWLTHGFSCSCSLDKDSAFMMSRSGKKAAALPAPADVPAVVNREVEGGPNPFEDMIDKSFSDGSVNV